MAMYQCVKIPAVAAGLLAAVAFAPAAWAQTPTEAVQATVNSVIDVLRQRGAAGSVDRERIGELIRASFYFRGMSQSIIGPEWRTIPEAERDRFVELFSQMLIRLYMGRIEAYTDETVEYTKEEVQDNRASVDTHIVTRDARIPIRYSLVEKDAQWLVYDVTIEGVSLIRNYRTSYREILRNEGMSGLLTRLQTKLEELESGRAGTSS